MATRADGTLPRSGKPANDAAKEAHAILVQAERGLTDSLAKPKVSNAKSLTGAFLSVSLRDATDRSVASAFAEFGEGAAEVRRLGDDGPGGKGVVRRLEGVAAMKQSRRERHESAVKAWETERDRVVDEALAGEAAAARDEAEALAKAKAAHGSEFGDDLVVYQEEDVLDTWFSSGLWPFSTLGWPDASAEDLKKFFPTTVMETGHDILFFWVARMVMLSYGMTGKAPFKTVFLHGLVRDEQGRKMSKSLGNVVDPLGVIEAQGCDALRFTLATGTAAGQDLNLNMDRLASNRNFTNKIWNAGKFVLYALGEMSDDERVALVAEAEAIGHFDAEALHSNLPLPSAWIVSELRATVDRVTAAHDRHDFGEAGRAAYAFFYDDFADWFIEASKARLYSDDEKEKRSTLAVATHALDQTLRLLHPFVPYVTEEVWRSLPHRGETLMCQAWPRVNAPTHDTSVAQFELLRSVTRAIRNARAEYAVEPARRVPATIVVAADADRDALAKELGTLASLARLDLDRETRVVAVPPEEAVANPASFVQQVVADGVEVFLPLAGIVDPAKESARLEKQAAKLEKEIGGLAGRLSSPKFVEKAPEEVVRKSEKELAELRERLAAVAARLEQMKALAAA